MSAGFALAGRRRLRLGRWLIAILVLIIAAIVAAAAASAIGQRAFTAVAGANPRWLLAAGLWSLMGYVVAGQALRGAAAGVLGPGEAMLLPFAGAAANRVLPAGTGAVAVTTRVLSTRGAAVPVALAIAMAAAIGTGLAGVVVVLAALGCVGAGAVVVPGLHLALPSWSGAGLPVIVATAAALAVMGALVAAARCRKPTTLSRPAGRVKQLVGRVVRQRPRAGTVARFLAFALVSRVTQLGVLLAAAAAVGHPTDVAPGLVVLGAGGIAGGLVPVAGGAGSVEATLTVALHAAGLPLPAALAAAVLNRLIGYWAPALAGVAGLAVLSARRPTGQLMPARSAPIEPQRRRLPLTGVAIAAMLALLSVAGASAWA